MDSIDLTIISARRGFSRYRDFVPDRRYSQSGNQRLSLFLLQLFQIACRSSAFDFSAYTQSMVAGDMATAAAAGGSEDADRNVETWKIKRLIKSLEAARGFDLCRLRHFWNNAGYIQKRHQHDLTHHSSPRSDSQSIENVGRRVRYCVEYQVARQQAERARRYYQCTGCFF